MARVLEFGSQSPSFGASGRLVSPSRLGSSVAEEPNSYSQGGTSV